MTANAKHEGPFLPTSVKEVKALSWTDVDVIIFSGDAYVDHPAFGTAIVGRLLESLGLHVAIVPQPNWRDDLRDFKKLGRPRLFFAVTAGNMDSMLNHYTARKRIRTDDAFTAGGIAGQRPDYATIVYTHILKKLYPDVPVIIGGVEASLRRLAHYDYWADEVKPSILFDSKADYLIYGMAEQPLRAIAKILKENPGAPLESVPQLAYLSNNDGVSKLPEPLLELPSYQKCLKDKNIFAQSFVLAEKEFSKLKPAALLQKVYAQSVVVNPPFPPMKEEELDAVYQLPYTRLPHPRYKNKGVIPAFEMIKNSVTIHRGCFGGCAFCSITQHQRKFIASRSGKSVVNELRTIAKDPSFKGHITDIGGPSANMYQMNGRRLELCAHCERPSCLFPRVCDNLNTSHKDLVQLYKEASKVKGIKKITIGSGIRYDLFLNKDSDKKNFYNAYIALLLKAHVSGRLKVAPEHTSNEVLKLMRKPPFSYFLQFQKIFNKHNRLNKTNYQLRPYLISGHPGTTRKDMAELSEVLKTHNLVTEQVQEFTPTPMTLSSVIYYTGVNPYTNEKVYVPRNAREKEKQKKIFFKRKS